MVEQHPDHGRCLPWLQRAQRGALKLQVAAHSIAELYAVLSTYPTRPRIPTAAAARLIRENVIATASVVALTGADYAAVMSRLAERSLPGGVVYDALIAQAAVKAGADRLVTLNPRDFERVWTGPPAALVTP